MFILCRKGLLGEGRGRGVLHVGDDAQILYGGKYSRPIHVHVA